MQPGHWLLRQGGYQGSTVSRELGISMLDLWVVLSNTALAAVGRPLWWAGTPLSIPHSPVPPLQTRSEELALPREPSEEQGTDK